MSAFAGAATVGLLVAAGMGLGSAGSPEKGSCPGEAAQAAQEKDPSGCCPAATAVTAEAQAPHATCFLEASLTPAFAACGNEAAATVQAAAATCTDNVGAKACCAGKTVATTVGTAKDAVATCKDRTTTETCPAGATIATSVRAASATCTDKVAAKACCPGKTEAAICPVEVSNCACCGCKSACGSKHTGPAATASASTGVDKQAACPYAKAGETAAAVPVTVEECPLADKPSTSAGPVVPETAQAQE